MQLPVSPDLESNPKKFFSFIKNKQNKNVGVSPLCESTTLKFTKQDRAHILNNQFSSVFSVDDKTSPNIQGPKGDIMHEINITKEGITRLIKNLTPSKAIIPDMISARFLKETTLHQPDIPDEWEKVNVTPIFKSGNKDHKANYRPVSLTSTTTCKVLACNSQEHNFSFRSTENVDRCSTCTS